MDLHYNGLSLKDIDSSLTYVGRKTATNGNMVENDDYHISDPAVFSYSKPNILNKYRGTIEQLNHSYGFILVNGKYNDRLFFHYSDFKSDLNDIDLGDFVEFGIKKDSRNGRFAACNVSKVYKEATNIEKTTESVSKIDMSNLHINHNILEGTVVTPARYGVDGKKGIDGKISYIVKGECFYLNFAAEEVSNKAKLKPGELIFFQMATIPNTLKSWAVNVHQPATRLRGIICSVKDSYGFIEREDVVREIFFHFTEFPKGEQPLAGKEVEFSLQMNKTGKETAVQLSVLSQGSVVLHDIDPVVKTGTILRNVNTSQGKNTDPFSGSISTVDKSGAYLQLPYGNKDVVSTCSIRPADHVTFQIATDRRDQLQKAVNISLDPVATFANSNEQRQIGVIVNVAASSETPGFIFCRSLECKLKFFTAELIIKPDGLLPVGSALEFSVEEGVDGDTVLKRAVRIRVLKHEECEKLIPLLSFLHDVKQVGHIQQEADADTAVGVIVYQGLHKKEVLCYDAKDCAEDVAGLPRRYDKVEFQVLECTVAGTRVACNVRVLERKQSRITGWVVSIKETFGFLEPSDHSTCVYFNMNSLKKEDRAKLEIGDEVEFMKKRSKNINTGEIKISADDIRLLTRGTIREEEASGEELEGEVLNEIGGKGVQPHQGSVRDDATGQEYSFTPSSVTDMRLLPRGGDKVRFSVSESNPKRAVRVSYVQEPIVSVIESLVSDSQYGFVLYEGNNTKTLFFHFSDVLGPKDLRVGDTVSFYVTHNAKNKKPAAVNMQVMEKATNGAGPRPERLRHRLKPQAEQTENVARVVLVRQPIRPDGSCGFSTPRVPWVSPEPLLTL